MEITFRNLLEQLEKKSPDFSEPVSAFQTFAGAAACLIGENATGGVFALLKAIDEKEKLLDLGKSLLDKITREKPDDYIGIETQMRVAYGTLFFTAFFDELNHRLPKEIRRKIQLNPEEIQSLAAQSSNAEVAEKANRLNEIPLAFPNSFYSSAKAEQDLEKLYQSMIPRLSDFISKTSFAEEADEREQRILQNVIEDLPTAAVNRFHDQFLILCEKIPTFRIYTDTKSIAALYDELRQQPTRIKKEKVQEIVDELIRRYRKNIDRPLIQDEDDTESLRYPALDKAFIPQRYRLLRYAGKEQRLELPKTWETAEIRNDMTDFWKGYLIDPNSVHCPLLILGEPGSGKSCLTEIVCGRMSAENNVMVRIPLREYDLEDEIDSIVCRQIASDGDADEPFHKLKWFTEEFPFSPITVFFDGYDEVMQATGGVYRNLLNKIRRFQERCRENGRPVRVVITSRDTLIDKADIPIGTAVMKLLEFDESQKQEWIGVWNACNRTIWSADGIHAFSLPDNSNIAVLSGQPLLLLMLAIYDADFERNANALQHEQGEKLDRTGLYDELLRRFIRRELRKGKRGQDNYNDADDDERQSLENAEMQKLGVSALGMFVREKLSLTVGELDDDLQAMNVRLPGYGKRNGRALKNAEALFGSFFFIHKPKGSKDSDGDEVEFEFLHKTFYEFLLADLTLQYYVDTLESLRQQRNLPKSKRIGLAYVDNALDPEQASAYYAALNGTCLCTEPEAAKMIAEWTEHKRAHYFDGDTSNFTAVSEDLFNSHFRAIRDGLFRPAWRDGGLTGERTFPQMCAVYLMNLLTMRLLTCEQCDIPLDDWKYCALYLKLNLPAMKKETEHKWNIEPSEEIILKFLELFDVGDTTNIQGCIQLQQGMGSPILDNLAYVKYWLSRFLCDNITANLYVLHGTREFYVQVKETYHSLIEHGMPLKFEYNLVRLHETILYPKKVDNKTLRNLFTSTIFTVPTHTEATEHWNFLRWDLLQCIRALIKQRPQMEWIEDTAKVMNFVQEMTSDSYPESIRLLAQEIENSCSQHICLFMMTPFADSYYPVIEAMRLVFEQAPFWFEVNTAQNYANTTLLENIHAHIASAHGFLAEVSEQNPNVMMEVGGAVMSETPRPIFLIREKDSMRLPADLGNLLAFSYTSRENTAGKIAEEIRAQIFRDGRLTNAALEKLCTARTSHYLSRITLENLPICPLDTVLIQKIRFHYSTVEAFLAADDNALKAVSADSSDVLLLKVAQLSLRKQIMEDVYSG